MSKFECSRRKRNVSTLFNISIRFITKNICLYKNSGLLQLFPFQIKKQLFYAIQNKYGFHDNDLLKLLIDQNLEHVNFINSKISDITLYLLSDVCINLRELKFNGGHYEFTKIGLVKLFGQMKKLKILVISNSQIDDEVLTILAKNSTELEFLDVSGSLNISDESVAVLQNLPLTALNLSTTSITDKSLEYLGTGACHKSLCDLNLSYCNVTKNGLKNLHWDVIKYIGFQGINVDNLCFMKSNGPIKFIQWTIDPY